MSVLCFLTSTLTSLSWFHYVTLLAGLLLFLYRYLTRNFGVFEAKGLVSIKPLPIFGNTLDIYRGKVNFIQFYVDFYRKFEGHK